MWAKEWNCQFFFLQCASNRLHYLSGSSMAFIRCYGPLKMGVCFWLFFFFFFSFKGSDTHSPPRPRVTGWITGVPLRETIAPKQGNFDLNTVSMALHFSVRCQIHPRYNEQYVEAWSATEVLQWVVDCYIAWTCHRQVTRGPEVDQTRSWHGIS